MYSEILILLQLLQFEIGRKKNTDFCYLCKEIKQSAAIQSSIKYAVYKSSICKWKVIKTALEVTRYFKGLDPS